MIILKVTVNVEVKNILLIVEILVCSICRKKKNGKRMHHSLFINTELIRSLFGLAKKPKKEAVKWHLFYFLCIQPELLL